jgi:ribonucleoside-diphosphate reductase alpha chain
MHASTELGSAGSAAPRPRLQTEGGAGAVPRRRARPAVLTGSTRQITTPFGSVFVTVNEDGDGNPFEVFLRLDKAGSRAMADAEAIARLISLALRWGISVGEIHRQLRGISCEAAGGQGVGAAGGRVLSIPDAVAQAIEVLVPDMRAARQLPQEA